jgi:hypothetical protein
VFEEVTDDDKCAPRAAVCSPGGVERLNFFKNVVAVPDASKTTLAWSFAAFGRSELWVALITFLYLDFLDATGTLFSMGELDPAVCWGGWHMHTVCIVTIDLGNRSLRMLLPSPRFGNQHAFVPKTIIKRFRQRR